MNADHNQVIDDETTIETGLDKYSLQTVENEDNTLTLTTAEIKDTTMAMKMPTSSVIPKPGSP